MAEMSPAIDPRLQKLLVQSLEGYEAWFDARQLPKMLNNPEFDDCRKVHDWRNYVPDEFAEIWTELPVEARLLAISMAIPQAANEEWE